MSRFAMVALAAFAYVLTLLMPLLPAQAAAPQPAVGMSMQATPTSCDHAAPHAPASVKPMADLCGTGCAAHAPALPSLAAATQVPWSHSVSPTAKGPQRLVAIASSPEPRPPRLPSSIV